MTELPPLTPALKACQDAILSGMSTINDISTCLKREDYPGFFTALCLAYDKLPFALQVSPTHWPKRRIALAIWKLSGNSLGKQGYLSHFSQVSESLRREGPVVAQIPQPSTSPKEIIMNKLNKIETVTYINGVPVKDMSDDQIIQTIRETEAQINDLAGIQTASKKLDAKRENLAKFIVGLVEILDAR